MFDPSLILRFVIMIITCQVVYPPIVLIGLLLITGIPLTGMAQVMLYINVYLASFVFAARVDRILERKLS